MKPKSKGREERLAAALRENLKRRKQRDRARGKQSADAPGEAAEKPTLSGPNPAAKPAQNTD